MVLKLWNALMSKLSLLASLVICSFARSEDTVSNWSKLRCCLGKKNTKHLWDSFLSLKLILATPCCHKLNWLDNWGAYSWYCAIVDQSKLFSGRLHKVVSSHKFSELNFLCWIRPYVLSIITVVLHTSLSWSTQCWLNSFYEMLYFEILQEDRYEFTLNNKACI